MAREIAPQDRLVTIPPWDVADLTLGWELISWASNYLKHPNGPRAGQRWEFTRSQVLFILHWYALNPDGSWVYHHGARRLVKGSGKSPVAGLLALGELCAPVRLKDFDPRLPGGCRGRPVDMPWVQIAATAESQTKNTMRMVRALAPKGSRIVRDFALDPGKTVYYKAPEGILEVITSSAAAAEGAEASFDVEDETEWWLPGNGGPELAATIEDNLAKSGNRSLETSNAWKPGAGSVAEATYDSWLAQEEGRTRGRGRILYDARIAPPDTDMADEASLRRALEHVYGDCWWQQVEPIMARIWDPRSRPDDSKRKYLNWPTVAQDAWTTPQDWARLSDPSAVVADGDEIVAFFDGSLSGDATALVGCHVETGHVFCIGVWEAPPPEPGGAQAAAAWQVPVAEVDAAVENMFDRWDVKGFFADVREWESFTKVEWPKRYASRLALHSVPGGKDPQAIAWDMRTRVYDFTMAAELTLGEISDEAAIAFTHCGDSRVARHVRNARNHPNRWGVSIAKETRQSPDKIDAAVCMIGARMVRRLYLASIAAKAPAKPRTGVVRGF
jgi:hypothetical protein